MTPLTPCLLSRGQIPEQGVITSLHSYSPPGLAWVALPGVLLFSDTRIVDAPGWVLLFVGSLVGVFLLARACFGIRSAFLSVLLYGLSERGLKFAGSMGGESSAGPRGHPFFYIWMAYWIYLWVARRDARYLAATCATWLVGMWVFMEIAPAVFHDSGGLGSLPSARAPSAAVPGRGDRARDLAALSSLRDDAQLRGYPLSVVDSRCDSRSRTQTRCAIPG